MATTTTTPSTVNTTSPLLGQRTLTFLRNAAALLVLSIGAFTMLIPLVWMASTSLKPQTQIFEIPIRWIPDPVVWDNYLTVWNKVEFWRGFLNSMFIAVTTTVAEVLVSAMAGYAFARMKFPGRDKFFVMLLLTMMIPGVVTMIPAFILFRMLGWINTYLPLIVPLLFGSAFATFLSRQFFLTLPIELEDAGKIDGANPWQIFTYIFLPLAGPILATLGGLGFIASWNDFLGPLIYLNDRNLFTIPLLLSALNGMYERRWDLLMAGSVIAIVPIILILIVMQKFFVESVAMTGLKG